MALDLDKIEGLTPEQITAISAQHDTDVKGLKDNNAALIDEKSKAKTAAEQAQAAADAAKLEAAKKSGDVESITQSFESKLADAQQVTADLQASIDATAKTNEDALLDGAAVKLANQLSEGHNVDIMSRFVKDRLRVEDGKVKVTDADGKLVMNTTDELLTEMRGDKRYASLVVVSKADGGGAPGSNGSGGQGGSTNTDTQLLANKVPGFSDLPVK